MDSDELSRRVTGCALDVHREFGRGTAGVHILKCFVLFVAFVVK